MVSIYTVGTLEHVRILDPVAQHGATLVMQALRAIPEKMLRRETFPPFIHPHPHRQALPEPLAICMRIAQIFATRTLDIRSFIWRTIKAEQARVLTEVNTLSKLSKQDLFAAIQAHMVYVIMRVIDGSREPLGWNHEMLLIGGMLCERFKEICNEPLCQDERSNPSLTWDDWIFAESRRRTSCAWFLLNCIISISNGLYCEVLEDVRMIPLPSPKAQWEASSHTGWENELEFNSNTLWTFGNLLDAHKWSNEPLSAQRLDSWNARIDNLGSLMNIATSIMSKTD
ncbi:hypothetical protein OIDMADRAFT_168993 [Oidiodendron maius Zn]|uniref:Transcription factor domain-containing protein n=1 Tax=Oidiodendron maius (strain Zn) TaxID=913774 RepID=A0A0C3GM92_OIDMZ|nr:hypothetical protein OIDMADRAFT_168993 [Oidiodendron maius Zn]